MKYPQLDGLRACAALLVVAHHTLTPDWLGPGNLGALGVRLFFVLSGFLITDILVRARDEATHVGASRGGVIQAFYARRFLRVFPLYYVALLLAFLIGIRAGWPWYLTYTQNVWMAVTHQFDPVLQHFWSLAIEEQFYLVWPCLVLWVPRQRIKTMFIATIIVATALRFIISEHASYLLMPTRMDAFAAGALLCLWVPGWKRPMICAGLAAVMLLAGVPVLYESAFVLLSLACLELAVAGLVPALQHRSLVAIGAVSYALYVFHPMTTTLVAFVERTFNVWLRFPYESGPVHAVLVFALSYAMAWISWRVLEGPLNQLKRYFPYVSASHAIPERHPQHGLEQRDERQRRAV